MLSPEQIMLLEKPFRKDEHGTVSNNPYILKSAIRKRLYQVDPHYELGAPEVMIHDQDVIVLRGPLTVGDVTHYGIGTGLIIRTKTVEKIVDGKKINEVVDLPLYEIARNMAKAYKQAASDILPRAAIQFNCGVYLAEKPKGMTLDDLLKKLSGSPAPVTTQQPPAGSPPPTPAPSKPAEPSIGDWATVAVIEQLIKNAINSLFVTVDEISRYTSIADINDPAQWNARYKTRPDAAEAIRSGLAADLQKAPPATPKKAESAAQPS